MKYKEIKLHPSLWTLDVIVGGSINKINKFCKKRYGADSYIELRNECGIINSSKKSQLKGKRRIVLNIESLSNKRAIVHELIHALWMFAKAIGYDMNYDTQEWQAVLFEYLYAEMCDKKGYKTITKSLL